MSNDRKPDPMEALVEEALQQAGISFLRDRDGGNPSGLDFRLDEHDVEIEVKRFHSDRISEQMSRAPNVIAAQGELAVRFLSRLLAGLQADEPEEDGANRPVEVSALHRHEALHTTFVLHDTFEKHIQRHPAIQVDAELRASAERVGDALAELYQLCGAKLL